MALNDISDKCIHLNFFFLLWSVFLMESSSLAFLLSKTDNVLSDVLIFLHFYFWLKILEVWVITKPVENFSLSFGDVIFFLFCSLSDVFSNFLNLWWCLAAFTYKSKTLKSCLEALCGWDWLIGSQFSLGLSMDIHSSLWRLFT